jgi:hypothetical protein
MIVQLVSDADIKMIEDPSTLNTFWVSINARFRILNADENDRRKLQQDLINAFAEVLNNENRT